MASDDFYASPLGAAYSAYMERPLLSRTIGRLVWGGDTRRYYESMAAVADARSGSTVVDCPCGAGPALRAVEPGRLRRYLAVDLSPAMLRRAMARAASRNLGDEVEFARADATAIPIADAEADLFLSYWGLHCFDDPAGALREVARALRPGGRLVGACFVGGATLRQRLLLRDGVGDFGRIGSESDIRSWLDAAGFELDDTDRSGLYFFFSCQRRAPRVGAP